MERIDTPEKVRTYLQEQQIAHDDNACDAHLFMLARRRLRRRLFQDGAISRASRINPALALSVEDLIKTLHRIRNKAADSGTVQKIYPTVTFKIDEWPDPNVVCLKHQVADDNKCKGRVVDGACNRCYCVVPGVLAYSFQVHIEDNTQPLATLTAWVSDKGGAALFGMPADQFNALTHRASAGRCTRGRDGRVDRREDDYHVRARRR